MLLFSVLALCFVFVNSRETPTVVSDLNVDNYLGHWKTVYQAPTNVIFQGYGTCITADYGLLDNGYVSVLNSQLNKNKEAIKCFDKSIELNPKFSLAIENRKLVLNVTKK
jgi:lipocalin